MTPNKPTKRKISILYQCVIGAIFWHITCVILIQLMGARLGRTFTRLLGGEATLPAATRFFIDSPNLYILLGSLLFVIWGLVYAFKDPSRRHSIILLTSLVLYTVLLAGLAFLALTVPFRQLVNSLGP